VAHTDRTLHLHHLDSKTNHGATANNTKLVHWPLMGGLLHLVQRGGAWAGCGPAQSPPRCTKITANPSTASVPITVLLYDGPLLCGFNVAIKGWTFKALHTGGSPYLEQSLFNDDVAASSAYEVFTLILFSAAVYPATQLIIWIWCFPIFQPHRSGTPCLSAFVNPAFKCHLTTHFC